MMTLRQLPATELALIQPLFAAVFDAPISSAMLEWKYGGGRGACWTGWQDDVLLVHCGVCRRDVLLQGEPLVASQLVDLMAAPKAAGLSRRNAPFTMLMQHILAQLPCPANPEGVAFGFPSARAMRLGELAGVYCAVDHWMALEFGARRVRLGPQVNEILVWGSHETCAVNALWRRMQLDLAAHAVGVRDMDYLRHRYLQRPDRRYQMLLVESRWRRLPLGLVVVGPGTADAELLDVIGAWADLPDVLLAVRCWLHTQGRSRLTLSLTSHFAAELAELADGCSPTQFRIMANPLSPEGTLRRLQQHWWLTGGDTDYR